MSIMHHTKVFVMTREQCLAHLSIAQVSLCHGAASVVRPSTFRILNFFSRTAKGTYSKPATNVPYEVPTKCCYFSCRSEIQYGLPGLWLADTFFNFFSRTAEGICAKFATNVPYEVLTKCCYFLSWSEIRYGRPGLWLADTFWTSSQVRLKGSTPNLPQMFLMRSRPSVVTF